MNRKSFTIEQAKEAADELGMSFEKWDVEEFCKGLNLELEHGTVDPSTDITNDDPLVIGKLAWAHLKKIPDFYSRLAEMKKSIGFVD
ncbi:MAG: hypothetical protein FWE97_03675 [Dehalococcoidia bacterium]|nr:hypothetical protein [Dehalococcoidia bacterium]